MGRQTLPFKLGIHPINWVGEDVKEHGDDYTYEQVLTDISSLGFEGTEMSRKFPTEVETLKRELSSRNLVLTTQWKSVLLSDASLHARELSAYAEHVNFLKQMDCPVVSTAEVGGSLHWDPRRSQSEKKVIPLDDNGWQALADGLNRAGEICRENGMFLVYHHHAGTVVERPEEIDRLMALTDPELVFLLFDTGHAFYGGNDPLQLLRKYYDRIKYIHFKDVREHVLNTVRETGSDFLTAVRKGVYTVPGDGCIDFEGIIKELLVRGYADWVLIEAEQDPSLANPYDYAKRAKEYIEETVRRVQSSLFDQAN